MSYVEILSINGQIQDAPQQRSSKIFVFGRNAEYHWTELLRIAREYNLTIFFHEVDRYESFRFSALASLIDEHMRVPESTFSIDTY